MSNNNYLITIRSSSGFTLLELLIALSIVSILVMTAIPQYRNFRAKAYDFRAQSDLRTVALGEEAYYLDREEYLACLNSSCNTLPGVARISKGVEIKVVLRNNAFLAVASHKNGSGQVYSWDSSFGGIAENPS